MPGDIAVSSVLLDCIDLIEVTGARVITIENLTAFNKFSEPHFFVIYLGGFHNTHRRNFIRRIYEQNRGVSFFHYGDIDAGGFYILLHLIRKTNINFKPYHMDIETLVNYSEHTRPLTENDRRRLNNLLDTEYHDVIKYMLKNNCKLEQEALDN